MKAPLIEIYGKYVSSETFPTWCKTHQCWFLCLRTHTLIVRTLFLRMKQTNPTSDLPLWLAAMSNVYAWQHLSKPIFTTWSEKNNGNQRIDAFLELCVEC